MKLAKENSHERDEHIEFEEETHTYTIKGDSSYTSVTTFIHGFFPEFNASEIIDKMMRSRNWENSKYYGMAKEEIIEMWEENKNKAAAQGTRMHADIENFYNELPVSNNTQEFEYFKEFHKEHKIKPFRTEWTIYDEELKLAGSIDMAALDEDGSLKLLDWKRSKNITESNSYEQGLYPVSHLPHANFWHYSLQLNIYKTILEKHYDVKVNKMQLVWLYPFNDSYITLDVPDLEKEVQMLFEERLKEVESLSSVFSSLLTK